MRNYMLLTIGAAFVFAGCGDTGTGTKTDTDTNVTGDADTDTDSDSDTDTTTTTETGDSYGGGAFTNLGISWVVAVGPDQSLMTWGDPTYGSSVVGLPSWMDLTLFNDAWDGSNSDTENHCDILIDITGMPKDATNVAGELWSGVIPSDAVVFSDTCGYGYTSYAGYLDAAFGGSTTIGIGPYDKEASDLLGTLPTTTADLIIGGYYNTAAYDLDGNGSKAVYGFAQGLDGSGNVLYDASGNPVFIPPTQIKAGAGVKPGLYSGNWLYSWVGGS